MTPTRAGLSAVLLAALCLVGCRETEPEKLLSALQVTDQNQLVGGPLAHGQVGDFLIENDEVRFVISGPHHSWGPGLFGGTVVDADLRRTDPFFRGVEGNDQFAELFPTANIVVGDPADQDVTVLKDGSDGLEAVIQAAGKGVMFLESLEILDPTAPSSFAPLLASLDVKTVFTFRTTYTLRPGARFLEIKTTVMRPEELFASDACPDACELECANGRVLDPETQCLLCECDTGRQLDLFTEPVPLLAQVLGSTLAPGADPPVDAGVLGGDWLFFGGGTDIFAPGYGFDEKGPIFANLFRGVDTITSPLTFDWLASAGKDVSYGIFTKRETKPEICLHRVVLTKLNDPADAPTLEAEFSGQAVFDLVQQRIPLAVKRGVSEADLPAAITEVETAWAAIAQVGTEPDGACRDPKVLIPLFTSSATLVAGAGVACEQGPEDDATCDKHRAFTFTRYLVVGDGDIASVAKTIYEETETPVGTVSGAVMDSRFGAAVPRSDIFAVADPDPTVEYPSYEAILKANVEKTTRFGVLNHAQADVGTNSQRNGSWSMTLPVGSWFLVARSPDGVLGRPERVSVAVGASVNVPLVVDPPAYLEYRVLDENGAIMPAKLTVVALGTDGEPMYADGKRRVELGDGRFDDGIFKVIYAGQGHGTADIEPGHYRITVSRGLEYSIAVSDVELRAGAVATLSAQLIHEVDTSGFISGDFHLHAENSMDSGMSLDLRVVTNIVEGVELLSSSEHDNMSDYQPVLEKLGLQSFATTQVGTELTTLELGHFLGFPMNYDHADEPVHGATDWVCRHPQELFDALRAPGLYGPEATVNVVAHPRDGFFGYWDQFALNPWTGERGELGLQANNPLLRVISCDFDAFELLNAKRFELIRTPTVGEINDPERCLAEINQALTNPDVRDACAWLRAPATCTGGAERLRGEPCAWYTDANAGFQRCTNDDTIEVCRDKARNAVTLLSVRRMVYRTPEEQLAWANATEEQRNSDDTECSPTIARGLGVGEDLEVERAQAPCAQHEGIADDWFTLLNYGMHVTAMGNSDSHGTSLEPGLPRNWVVSGTDDASRIDKAEIAANIKAQKVVASTGPFVEVSINGVGMGETASVSGEVELKLRIQTPSWFGISRIEIYRNGTLAKGIDVDVPASAIIDFDEVVTLPAPGEDSWYVVSAVGLDEEDFLAPVYHTSPLGELSFSKITALAFQNLGAIGTIIGTSSQIPDYFPTLPYAMTNPIRVDVDGDGYTPPLGDIPPFCPVACATAEDCPREGDICHTNADVGMHGDGGTCGPDIEGECGVAELAERKEAALRVAPGAQAERAPLADLRDKQRDAVQRRRSAHTVMRYMQNSMLHPTHAHPPE